MDRAVKSDSGETNGWDPDHMEVTLGQRAFMCRDQTFAEKLRFNGTNQRLRYNVERMALLIVSHKVGSKEYPWRRQQDKRVRISVTVSRCHTVDVLDFLEKWKVQGIFTFL